VCDIDKSLHFHCLHKHPLLYLLFHDGWLSYLVYSMAEKSISDTFLAVEKAICTIKQGIE